MKLPFVERLLLKTGSGRFKTPPTPDTLAPQLENALKVHALDCWFPLCVDREGGGFFETFARDWSKAIDGPRSVVFQARMTWVAAALARRGGAQGGRWSDWASHGLRFLCDRLWDHRCGGFFWREDDLDEKHAYGVAFGIYAAAAAYRAGIGSEALDLAHRSFEWLDRNAHDDEHGGYFEALQRDGSPLAGDSSHRGRDRIGVPAGFKSTNTHLHLLEAFAELYRARPSAELRSRLEELTHVVGDSMPGEDRTIATWFSRDWRPTNHTVSYGHSLEAAYLLIDAAGLLESDLSTPRVIADRALERGYDPKHGGVYSEGMPGEPASKQEKVWWVQAEALNCLLVLHEQFGHQTSIYWARFLETWSFIHTQVIDHRHRGWFAVVSRSGCEVRDARKGHRWKAAYHDVRALVEASERLRRIPPTDAVLYIAPMVSHEVRP